MNMIRRRLFRAGLTTLRQGYGSPPKLQQRRKACISNHTAAVIGAPGFARAVPVGPLPGVARLFRPAVIVAILAVTAVSLHASSPKFFQAATQAEFLRGDIQNLSVDNRGQLTLGLATELIYETAAPFLWSLAAGPDGTLFIGTGNEGRVFKVDAQGKGTPFFDAAELEAHALATAPDGSLFVGSSPDGTIYKVDRNGAAQPFFDPDDRYIWALTLDPKGNLYAATGDRGVIYKISPDGKGTRFYQAKAMHATALAFDKAGNLLVGTESPGRVLRIGPDGKAFVLLDSPFQEIRSLRFDDKGVLYAAAVSGRDGGGTPPAPRIDDRSSDSSGNEPRAPIATVTAEVTSISIVDVSSGGGTSASGREDRRAPRGAIYRITSDGLWDQLWESRDDSPYDLAFDVQGRLIVGTGNKGKIYRLEGDPPQPTLLAGAGAQQVTALYKDPKGRLYFATANPGKLFRLDSDRAAGEPTSPSRATRGPLRRGESSAGAARCPQVAASRSSRGRATPIRRTTPGAPGRRRTPWPRALP